MNTPDEMIEVTNAIKKKNKKIQYFDEELNKWVNMDDSLPNFKEFTYRVKPDEYNIGDKFYSPYSLMEFLKEQINHGTSVINDLSKNICHTYIDVNCGIVVTYPDKYGSMQYRCETLTSLLLNYKWDDDGTHCGKEVTE